jgi:hypothetical protein
MDRGEVKPPTRNSLDWSPRYGATAEALRELKASALISMASCAPLRRAQFKVIQGARRI